MLRHVGVERDGVELVGILEHLHEAVLQPQVEVLHEALELQVQAHERRRCFDTVLSV